MSTRRGWLAAAAGALSAVLGLVVGLPTVWLVTAPARRPRDADEPLDLGELARLPEGVPVRVPAVAKRRLDAWTAFTDVALGAAWLVRRGGEVQALSTVCPHAGCAVDWRAEAQCFGCPCHDSVFGLDGQRRSGPAPRGLDPLDVEIKDGRVRVTWRRYRQGVAGREPA